MMSVMQVHDRPTVKYLIPWYIGSSRLILLLVWFMGSTSLVQANCLLSFEPAHTIRQGNVNITSAFFGGQNGVGFEGVARLGMKNKSELHLRSGGCDYIFTNAANKEVSVFAAALELGSKFTILTKKRYGVDVSGALSIQTVQGSDGVVRGNAVSSVGLMPYFMVGYPFHITAKRKAFVALSLGLSTAFIDQNYGLSDNEFNFLSSLSAGVEILQNWSILSEIRFHKYFYGGGALAFHF
jgi:hypothetical protein